MNPPVNIWPDPTVRFRDDQSWQWIDTSQYLFYLSQQDFLCFNRNIIVDCTRKVRCIMPNCLQILILLLLEQGLWLGLCNSVSKNNKPFLLIEKNNRVEED